MIEDLLQAYARSSRAASVLEGRAARIPWGLNLLAGAAAGVTTALLPFILAFLFAAGMFLVARWTGKQFDLPAIWGLIARGIPRAWLYFGLFIVVGLGLTGVRKACAMRGWYVRIDIGAGTELKLTYNGLLGIPVFALALVLGERYTGGTVLRTLSPLLGAILSVIWESFHDLWLSLAACIVNEHSPEIIFDVRAVFLADEYGGWLIDKVDADSRSGTVYVRGRFFNEEARKRAQRLPFRVRGVRKVFLEETDRPRPMGA